jgi:hypothetical protein
LNSTVGRVVSADREAGCVRRFWFAAFVLACATTAHAEEALKFGPPPGWVKPVAVEPAKTGAEQAPIRLLLSDSQFHFDRDGLDVYSHAVARFQTAQSLTASGLTLSWRPDAETITVHRALIRRGEAVIDLLAGGQKFTVLRRETNLERAMLDGVLTATLQPEGLQVGDIVEFDYTRRAADPVLQGRNEAISFQSPGAKVDKFSLRASWPKDRPVRWRQTPGLPAAVEATAGDRTELTIDGRDLERPKPPNGAPGRYGYLSVVEMTEFKDWAELSALMEPLYVKASTLKPGSPLLAEVARIKAESVDPKARAAAALTLVQSKVRYLFLGMNLGGYTPTDADVTWERRFGDCKAKTALLLALLRELDIPAEAAMVHSTMGDGLDERLPAIEMFDHILVRATIGGKTYWLDGTRPADRDLDLIPAPPFSWALPVRRSGASLVAIEVPPLQKPSVFSDIRIDATAGLDAPALAHVEVTLTGDAALPFKMASESLSKEDLDKRLKQSFAGQLGGLDVAAVDMAFDDKTGEMRLTLDGATQLRWTLDESTGLREMVTDEGRMGARLDTKRDPGPYAEAPFRISHPMYSRSREVIVLPQGGRGFTVSAENVDKTIANTVFKRTAKIENGVLTVDLVTQSLGPEITFAEANKAKTELRELYDSQVTVRSPKKYKVSDEETKILETRKPATVIEYLSRADAWTKRRDLTRALQDADAAVALQPEDANTLNARCWVRALAGVDLQKALEDCDAALDAQPNAAQVLDSRGLVYYRLGKPDRAIADLNQALKVRPGLANSLYVRGLAKRASGDSKGGRDDVDAARKIDRAIGSFYADYGVKP